MEEGKGVLKQESGCIIYLQLFPKTNVNFMYCKCVLIQENVKIWKQILLNFIIAVVFILKNCNELLLFLLN